MIETRNDIESAIAELGDGPLNESAIVEHIHPLFSRVLARTQRTGEIYLANHSLGCPMDAIAVEVNKALDAWYDDLDGAWTLWIEQRDLFRRSVARLTGCSRWDAVVPKTSAGQGLRAVINALPNPKPTIVSTRGEFDSIDFNLKASAHKQRSTIRWVDSDDEGLFHADDLIAAIDDETDLVVVSMVCFVTGQLITDLDRVIAAAHRHSALVLVDAYHAFGTIPIDFERLDADFLIAGSYKYTRGGAGACFLVINPKHLSTAGGIPPHDALFTTDTGWFAKQDTFAYRRTELPEFAPGGDAWLESTPPPLVYFQAMPGLSLVSGIGVDRIRAYSIEQQAFLRDELEKVGISTRRLDHHGAFVLIPSDDGREAVAALKNAGVNADARPCPKTGKWFIRLCPDLLNTRDQLREASARIGRTLGI